MAGSAVAGAVSTTLITVAAPASLAASFLVGGIANVAGNQAGALAEGTLETLENSKPDEFWNNYENAGGIFDGNQVTNLEEAGLDFLVGGAVNAAFDGIQHVVSKGFTVSDPFAKPQRNSEPIQFVYQGNGNYSMKQPRPLIESYSIANFGIKKGIQTNIPRVMRKLLWDSTNEFTEQEAEKWY